MKAKWSAFRIGTARPKALSVLAACTLLGVTTAANASSYVVTLEEMAGNVVANGSGSIDTNDLTFFYTAFYTGAGVIPNLGFIGTGPEVQSFAPLCIR
jgi:hypothetical protein